ncbi:MAG: DnaJ C-terminal domain-containing protein [Myxococcota bacterium]
MSEPDYYAALGIDDEADASEIRRAYHRVAKAHHPDIRPDDEISAEIFRRATEAYDRLSDPDWKQHYDARRKNVVQPRPSPTRAERAGAALGAFMRNMRSQSGHDLKVRVPLTVRELATGARRTVGLERDEPCDACAAKGCPSCGERGRRTIKRRVEVEIPAGATSLTRLRIKGEGEPGRGGGAPGDLIVTVDERPDPLLTREGTDLIAEVPIMVSDLVLGAELLVPSLEGRRALRLPPGSDPFEPIRLPGLGMPSTSKKGARGDLVVRLRVDVSPRPTTEQVEVMRQYRELERRSPSRRRRHFEDHISALADIDDRDVSLK